jgi:hypothetical protein
MILTLFLQGDSAPRYPPQPTAFRFASGELRSKYTLFFITGFSICHSFLDFLYIGVSRGSEK